MHMANVVTWVTFIKETDDYNLPWHQIRHHTLDI